jgi:hypothetical protein
MSIRDIIEHSVNKNPLAMKEALDEEMRNRIAIAIQEKMMAEKNDEMLEASDDEDDEDEDDADDDADDAEMASEMKNLHASSCGKTEMYAKMKEKYGCDKATFEGLYASNCTS